MNAATKKAPDWIMFEPARWLVGTAELDAMTEFVFFRLCMLAYEAGDPVVSGSSRRNAVRCKVPVEVYEGAVELLIELGKVEQREDGLMIRSVDRRLKVANDKIAARQRGAAIARRRGQLKAEGRNQEDIDLIIRREFPDDQAENATDKIREEKKREDEKREDEREGYGERELQLLPTERDPLESAVEAWNVVARTYDLPVARVLTDQRRKALAARMKEAGGLEGWMLAMRKVTESDFLLGRKAGSDWKADLDFVLQKKSFTRLMEDSYRGRSGKNGTSRVMQELRGLLDGE